MKRFVWTINGMKEEKEGGYGFVQENEHLSNVMDKLKVLLTFKSRKSLCACMDGYCSACRLRDAMNELKKGEEDFG